MKLINRIIYGVYNGWKLRQQLRQVMLCSNIDTVKNLNIDELKALGIKVLVLDFDGVLAPYGVNFLEPEINAWLKSLIVKSLDVPLTIWILSNNPTLLRMRVFKAEFPQVNFMQAARKKPYPDGLLAIMQLTGANKEQVLLVDDRLLTGCLAAILAGVKIKYVTVPTVSLASNFIIESGFCILRWLERQIFTILGR